MQIKAIASSAEPLQLTADTNLGFAGLAGITNEDPNVDVYVCHVGPSVTPAGVNEIIRGGTLFAHGFGMQYQVQNMSTGNIPSEYWAVKPRSVRCRATRSTNGPIAHLRKMTLPRW